MKKLIEVKYWISADEESLRGLKECDFDEWHQDALIKELVNNKYIICGDTHQSPCHPCVPVFNDGYLILSMRRWAEIMGEAYVHINPIAWPEPWFYMASTCTVKEELPSEEVNIFRY